MSDPSPFLPEWSAAVDPRLANRLLRRAVQPGLVSRSLADAVVGRVTRLEGRLPLLGELRRRHTPSESMGTGGAPIVYAGLRLPEPAGDGEETSPPALQRRMTAPSSIVSAPTTPAPASPGSGADSTGSPSRASVSSATPVVSPAHAVAAPDTALVQRSTSAPSAGSASSEPMSVDGSSAGTRSMDGAPTGEASTAGGADHGVPTVGASLAPRSMTGGSSAEVSAAPTSAGMTIPLVQRAPEPQGSARISRAPRKSRSRGQRADASAAHATVTSAGLISSVTGGGGTSLARSEAAPSDGDAAAAELPTSILADGSVETVEASRSDVTPAMPVVAAGEPQSSDGPGAPGALPLVVSSPSGGSTGADGSPSDAVQRAAMSAGDERPRGVATASDPSTEVFASNVDGTAEAPLGDDVRLDDVQTGVGTANAVPIVTPTQANVAALPSLQLARMSADGAAPSDPAAGEGPAASRGPASPGATATSPAPRSPVVSPAAPRAVTLSDMPIVNPAVAAGSAGVPAPVAAPVQRQPEPAVVHRRSGPAPGWLNRMAAESLTARGSRGSASTVASTPFPTGDATVVQRASGSTEGTVRAAPMPLAVPAANVADATPPGGSVASLIAGSTAGATSHVGAAHTTGVARSADDTSSVGGFVPSGDSESAPATVIRRSSDSTTATTAPAVSEPAASPWQGSLTRPLTLPTGDSASAVRRSVGRTPADGTAVPIVRPRAASGAGLHRSLGLPDAAPAMSSVPVDAAATSPLTLPHGPAEGGGMRDSASPAASPSTPLVRATSPDGNSTATIRRAPLVLPTSSEDGLGDGVSRSAATASAPRASLLPVVQRTPAPGDGGRTGAPPLAVPRAPLEPGAAFGALAHAGSLANPPSLQRELSVDGDAFPALPSRTADVEEDDDGSDRVSAARLADQVYDRLLRRLAGERSRRGW